MFNKGTGLGALALLSVVALAAAAAAPGGEELTPEQRRALENEARGLNDQWAALFRQGKLPQATAALEKVVALRRRLYPKGHPDLATSLNKFGQVLEARGDWVGAERHYRAALAMRRQLYPDDSHPDLAQNLTDLGRVLIYRWDLGRAESLLREALALRRRLYPKDHPLLAASLINLGSLLYMRGDLAGAERHYAEALAMQRRLYPNGHPFLVICLHNLADLQRRRRDLDGAEKNYAEALAMCRRIYPKDHPNLARALNAMGIMLRARENLDGAERHLRDALAMRSRLAPNDHAGLAPSLIDLGDLLRDRGDLGEAERHLRDALAMLHGLHPEGHPSLESCLSALGFLRHAQGNLSAAQGHHAEALAMRQRYLFREAGLLAEADALNLTASLGFTRDAFLSVTRGRPAATYDLVWRGRSAVTRIIEQRHRDLLASRDPETRALGDHLLSTRQRLSHLLLDPAKETAKHAAAVRKLTEEKEDLEKELAQKLHLEMPPTDPTPPPPQRLAELLPPGACFLDFYRYTHYEFDPEVKGIKGERRTPHYVAFVVTRGQPVVRVELGEAAPLEQAWAAWHDAIVKDAPRATERQAATVLAKLVWDPLREKLPPGIKTLYLAPDGALTQVPWAALPGAKPETVLLEAYAFATVPHGPFLLQRLAAKATTAERGTLLAVGGVDYARPPAPEQVASAAGALPAAGKAVVWRELKGTAPEARRVAALAKSRDRLEPRLLTGPAATTGRVLAELPKARYAHLATHGFFADATFLSALQADPREFGRLTPDRRGGARSPLVLSGLVFAGANRVGEEAEADRGILTAEALVGLRLDGLELAVLSACNTGLGEVGGGEGVYGLQRAFHVAGCKNVVASLWEVGDQSTAALMALFYRNLWGRKLDPLQALRQAQLELYRHPERIQEIASRAHDWTPRPLPNDIPGAAGERARTAQWAAFTFSGVAAPPRAASAGNPK